MKAIRDFLTKKEHHKLIILLAALLGGAVLFFAQSVEKATLEEKDIASVTSTQQEIINSADAPSPIAENYNFELKPHKALYDIDLIATRSGSQIVNISGEMYYEWQPTCEAWISNHRFDLLYEYADSSPMRITSDFSTYETFDARNLDFTSRRKRDGELFEELRGHARIKETGVGEVVYTKPSGLVQDLPKGTVFPIEHSRRLLKQIRDNKKFMSLAMFDGSDEKGPVQVNSFIGEPVNAMAEVNGSSDLDTTLLNTRAWKARLAFFPLEEQTALADYEMDIVFHQNGVISDMVIEYDDFSISQTLRALEPVESDCNQEAAKEEETD